jgi:hypothetical protein
MIFFLFWRRHDIFIKIFILIICMFSTINTKLKYIIVLGIMYLSNNYLKYWKKLIRWNNKQLNFFLINSTLKSENGIHCKINKFISGSVKKHFFPFPNWWIPTKPWFFFSISQCFIFIQKIQCTQVQLLSSI